MSTVVDSSLLVAATLDAGTEGIWAEQVLKKSTLTAPQLVLVEAANIFRRLELAGRVTALEAASARRDVLSLDITLFPFAPIADRIWELRANVTCYDAWYVALAEALNLPLATLDRRLSKAKGPTCRFLLPD